MAIELARTRILPKPWGVGELRPWSECAHEGQSVGEICYERSSQGGSEPALLLKILLTSQPLSIQVHPDDAVARAMGLPNGKSEAWCILSAAPGAQVALGLKRAISAQQLRSAIGDGSISGLVAWRGVAAGETVDVPAGTIHAIGAGLVIAEIQQRSDTTFRLFDHGRSREIHLEAALASASTEPVFAAAAPDRLSSERTLLASNRHFVFERIELAPESTWCLEAGRETWLLVLDGAARADDFDVAQGNAVFAQSDRVRLRVGASGVVCLVAYTGDGGPVRDLLQQLDEPAELAVLKTIAMLMPPRVARTGEASAPMGTIR